MVDFTTELANAVKGANRAIVAQQLRFAGSVPGNVRAFNVELVKIGWRYIDKLDGLASQGANVTATKATISNLVATASTLAVNNGTVKVPAAA
ncbi:hypothetical protein ACKWRH_25330 [Bradyrhizobium sp. Pa8]|uniref:hypothetical protein n=1 Tax=Bradyrhizobium sp. Pa8 TaxID=3386552 RepID=UPI00403FA888